MTVAELIAVLAKCQPDAEVLIWLPGSRITLGGVTRYHDGTVLVEGNLTPRSLLAGGPGERTQAKIGITNRPTASDIRKSYEEHGCEVHIDRDGRIKFRPADSLDRTWLDGLWVSEYRFEDGRITCI